MSQSPYNAISQGPAIIPMENYNGQQRITPAPEKWCTPRRTKIIVAIVILAILWVALIVVWIVASVMAKNVVSGILEEASRNGGYSYTSSRNY